MADVADPPWLRVLRALSADSWTSGESLAGQAGVTRAAIWKQIGTLEAQGIEVERRRGQGYRLLADVCLLDETVISPALQAAGGGPLVILAETPSTNAWLREAVRRGTADTGTVCLAEYQPAGRGRRGRTWVSAACRNVAMSISWRFAAGIGSLGGLSVAVGVALADGLAMLGLEVSLKWPNDLVCASGKLGGILIEVDGQFAGPADVVIGIGLNIDQPRDARIDQSFTDLARELGHGINRNEVIAVLASAVLRAIIEFEFRGLAGFLPRWEARDVLRGHEVRTDGANPVCGRAVGVDADGYLLVRQGHETHRIAGGEVSVRPDDG